MAKYDTPEEAYRAALDAIESAGKDEITELSFSEFGLAELPPEVVQLTQLKELNLSSNQLTSLPSEIVQLTQLTNLNLSSNQLSNLPSEVVQLTQLKELNLRSNQLTSLPPEIVQLTRLTGLSFAGNQLTSLPPEIGQLSQLTSLKLSRNQLTSLPPEIVQLTQLTELSLGSNQLTSLPPEIIQLTQLTKLRLGSNQLTSLSPKIGQLTQLTLLDLSGNLLTSLPPEIGQLTQLTSLELSRNQLASLPPEIGQLKQLTHLYLYNNQLDMLPPEIGQLIQLIYFSVWGNHLTSLPIEVCRLVNLNTLRLGGTAHESGFKEFPMVIFQLTNLRNLLIHRNQLTSVPPEIGQLTQLTSLDLRDNQLNSLPPEIGQLIQLTELYLKNNRLPIPPEIVDNFSDPQAILKYYFETAADAQALNEAKLVLVGEGAVGKTSLVNRLIHDTFNPDETKTEGILITSWLMAKNGDQEIDIHVWDFGGQEIMHATHQFFLTKRTLYLLAVNARQSEAQNNLHYWLKVIETFGGDSPIIIVANKAEEHPLDWDIRQLQVKYPQIKNVIETDCETRKGIDELQQIVKTEIGNLDYVNTMIPLPWYKVKEGLEQQSREQDYVPFDDYVELCKKEDITGEKSQEMLIGFLHDLGVVLNFRDDRYTSLQETHILNPQWVTEGVYKIINARNLLESEGILSWPALRKILTKPRYPRDRERRYILDMMRKFELCFSFRHGEQEKFLVPDLLPKPEPSTGSWNDALVFEYHYPEVLPSSLISRFIVRMEANIHQRTYWRSGVLLAEGKNQALVRADGVSRIIHISVRGQPNTRREFMAVIRNHIETINKSIAKLEAICKVPIPGQPGVLVDYDYLLENEAQNIIEIIPPGAKAKINVKTVLNGYESEQDRLEKLEKKIEDGFEKMERRLEDTWPAPKMPKEKEIFVSYAWGGDSEEMVDAICAAFETKGYIVTRDKSHMNYRDSIHDFMRRIGRGQSIIAVVSDKYMKSEYCMYEAYQMFQAPNLRDRIFPIVLPEVNIFDFETQADYLIYWAEEYEKLKVKHEKVAKLNPTMAAPLTERLRDIEVTTRFINDFMAQVADMNVWTAEMHEDEGFETLINEVVKRVEAGS